MQLDQAITASVDREAELWQIVLSRIPLLLGASEPAAWATVLKAEDAEITQIALRKVSGLASAGPEWDRVMGGIQALSTVLALDKLPNDPVVKSLAEAYEVAREATVDQLLGDQQILLGEFDAAARELESFDRMTLMNGLQIMREAFSETGTERPVRLREARSALAIGASSGWLRHTSTWFAYAWLNYEVLGPTQESINLFRHVLSAPRRQGLSETYAHRALAALLMGHGDVAAAVSENSAAIGLRACFDSNFESASLTAMVGRLGSARSLLEAAVCGSPMLLLRALAAKAFTPMLPDVQAVASRAQTHARQEARQAVATWSSMAKKVSDAETALGTSLPISRETVEGHEKATKSLDTGSLWEVVSVRLQADSARDELKRTAFTAVSTEHRKRAELVDVARKTIESMVCARDEQLEKQMETEEQSLAELRGRVRGEMAAGEKIQKSGVTTMGAGCGLFSLVLVGSGAATFAGAHFSPNSPLGMSLLGLGALPVVGGVVMQIMGGVKRMALDGQLSAAESRVARERARIGKALDDQLRSRLDAARTNLEERERGVIAAETAVQILGRNQG